MTIDLHALAERAFPGSPHADALMGTAAAVLVGAITDEVRELHHPLDQKLWTMDCIDGDCGHWTENTSSCEDHCPPVADQVCAHCYEMGDRPDDGWETYFGESINWPCPTVRLLDTLDAACGREAS